MKENFGIRSLAVTSWWMAAISLWPLDGCCYFLMGSGWLLLFPGGLWMVASCSPCLVHTFWHIASLKLKEIFGTR